ncbi:unnamed protein product [Cyclocybe aegerita]|uniref:Cytochrome P450 n=1 Tax=Cyclocybe aegerita TaxID=1973307 RepID=A0A8S0W9N2_CYCAE|nr:unnamed protein product [Cyclocybe aegerita]
MSSSHSYIPLLAAGVFGGLLWYVISSGRRMKLPPGPKRLPVIGNAHQVPTETPWRAFSEWGKKYGDIMHIDIVGKPIVIINSEKIARDLLVKRATIYSDRPHFVMAGELVGYSAPFAMQSYNDNWRRQRRLISHDFAQNNTPRYHGLQEKGSPNPCPERSRESGIARLSSQIARLTNCTFISLVSRRLSRRIGIIIFRVTYGYYLQSENDPILTTPLEAMDNFSYSTTPGNFLVDFIPILKYLPRWVPGSGFLATAERWRKLFYDSTYRPYNWCKKNLETGQTLLPNLCATILQNPTHQLSEDEETKLIWAASSVLGGGLDTNMSSALTFYLAMILNPSIQEKAHAEIEAVVGKDRLPTINDRPNLPYIRSIITEVLRSSPAIPLCLPHCASQDDIYNGLLIPKGSMIMPNIWHMLHDPEAYPNPMEFYPERFNNLDSEMDKVKDLVFGFGRRVCPGMHFAEGTLFAIVSTTLATCKILPGLDANGKEKIPEFEFTSGTIIFPKPFTLRLKARSTEALGLLAEVSTAVE